MKLLPIAAGVVGTAALLGMVSAGGAGAQPQASNSTIHLIATTSAYDDTVGSSPAATDIYAYKTVLRDTDADRVGRENCFCVATDADSLVCTGVLTLTDGTLTYTLPFSNNTGRGTGAITGGTGRYTNATGTFKAVFRANTDPGKYDYYLNLRKTRSGPLGLSGLNVG